MAESDYAQPQWFRPYEPTLRSILEQQIKLRAIVLEAGAEYFPAWRKTPTASTATIPATHQNPSQPTTLRIGRSRRRTTERRKRRQRRPHLGIFISAPPAPISPQSAALCP